MELAAMKTSHPVLLASPRNALPNAVSILQDTSCNILFYSGAGTPLEPAAGRLKNLLPSLTVVRIPSIEETIAQTAEHYKYTRIFEEAKDEVIIVPHASNPNSCPKLIYYSNAFFNRIDADNLTPQVPSRRLANLILSHPGDLRLAAFLLFYLTGIGCLGLIGPNHEHSSGRMACEIAKSLDLRVMLILRSICDTMLVPLKSQRYSFESHPELLPSFDRVSGDELLSELVVRRPADPKNGYLPAVFTIITDHKGWRTRDLFRRCTDAGAENAHIRRQG